KSGIAHFLEHLMFKGTAKNPAGRFSQQLASIGGQENAFTSSDYTGYFQRTDNEPSARLGEQVQAAQYLNHPYHRPTIGWRHEMETLDRVDALNFYRRYYQPDNAVLIVAGDVTPEEVKELAEKTYGKIERRPALGPRIRPKEPPQIVERRVTFADLRVTQRSLQRSYLVPSYTTAKENEAEALDLLAYVL